MNDKPLPLLNDVCLPFQIEGQDIKGRVLRLGPSVHEILSSHNYPDHISKILGQTLALTALLGSLMKYDGIFTTQLKGEGSLRLIVSDLSKDKGSGTAGAKGIIRGYAGFNDGTNTDDKLNQLFGDGAYLAITIDQGKFMERYQGIVSLKGENLTQAAEEYFQSSEQLPTKVMIECEKDENGRWQAGAIMIQHLARNTELELTRDEEKTVDNWDTASILLSSLKPSELLDENISLQQLLIRLYHETGIRIFDHTELAAGCRCSEEKIRTVLSSLNLEELKEVAEDGTVTVTCDFCTKDHKFELTKLLH